MKEGTEDVFKKNIFEETLGIYFWGRKGTEGP